MTGQEADRHLIVNSSGNATKLPAYVYLLTVDGEWRVSTLPEDHPQFADDVIEVANQRNRSGSPVHIWRARLVDIVEMVIIPEEKIPARLEERRRDRND